MCANFGFGALVMTIYVVEIKGQGIAAFHANSQSDAEIRAQDRSFRDDLMVLATNGPAEEAKWRASRSKAIRHGNIDADDEGWIAFLVALTDSGRRKR